MAYESLIEDIDLVQGDSSAIWFIGLPDGRLLNDGNWSARYIVSNKFGDVPIINNVLPLNSGLGESDTFTAATKFIFQILPGDSQVLTGNKKYSVTVEISNPALNYNGEIARFIANVLVGS